MTLDTLACDSAQIVALQQNPAYNYNRELMAREETLWEWLKMQIAEWWHSLMYRRLCRRFDRVVPLQVPSRTFYA